MNNLDKRGPSCIY